MAEREEGMERLQIERYDGRREEGAKQAGMMLLSHATSGSKPWD